MEAGLHRPIPAGEGPGGPPSKNVERCGRNLRSAKIYEYSSRPGLPGGGDPYEHMKLPRCLMQPGLTTGRKETSSARFFGGAEPGAEH